MKTTGRAFLDSLPKTHTAERERLILEAVERGDFVLSWTPVVAEVDGVRVVVSVSTDSLRIGTPEDSVRVSTTHATAQRIADRIGAVLPTAKLADLTYQAAPVKLTPHVQTPDRHMSDTDRMSDHHVAIEVERAGRCGLMRPVGKDWCNTTKLEGRPHRGANYGWHAPGARYQAATLAGGRVWQPGPGLAHDAHKFTDYSQFPTFVQRTAIVATQDATGIEMDLFEVALDANLARAISSEGPLELRHPGVQAWAEDADDDEIGDRETPTSPITPRPVPLFTRTLSLTDPAMVGDDVAFVQRIVGAHDDGVFGPKTKSAVQYWQANKGLDDDGIVGPKTRAKMLEEIGVLPVADRPAVPTDTTLGDFDLEGIEFVECKNYTRKKREAVHFVVLHSMEAHEKPSTAEAVAAWGAGANAPSASWHYAIDNDSIVACVREEFVAWHAPGANAYGVGYEMAGFARQSREQWLDDYSIEVINNAARLAARVTLPRWKIPLRWIDRNGVAEVYRRFKANEPIPDELRGYTTHNEVSLGVHKSTHTDPGPHFPRDVFEKLVREAS